MYYNIIDKYYTINIYLNKEIPLIFMKKFIVETYYTCTFKTVHSLDNLDEAELSKIDQRTDGDVEVN